MCIQSSRVLQNVIFVHLSRLVIQRLKQVQGWSIVSMRRRYIGILYIIIYLYTYDLPIVLLYIITIGIDISYTHTYLLAIIIENIGNVSIFVSLWNDLATDNNMV